MTFWRVWEYLVAALTFALFMALIWMVPLVAWFVPSAPPMQKYIFVGIAVALSVVVVPPLLLLLRELLRRDIDPYGIGAVMSAYKAYKQASDVLP